MHPQRSLLFVHINVHGYTLMYTTRARTVSKKSSSIKYLSLSGKNLWQNCQNIYLHKGHQRNQNLYRRSKMLVTAEMCTDHASSRPCTPPSRAHHQRFITMPRLQQKRCSLIFKPSQTKIIATGAQTNPSLHRSSSKQAPS